MRGKFSSNSSDLHTLRMDLKKRARELAWTYSPDGPPYHPALVAKGLRVRVEEAELTGIDGYVEVKDEEYRAVISSKGSIHRRRFTLGHELCHVILMRAAEAGNPIPLVRFRANGGLPGLHQDPIEESLCDYFAGELLMPSDKIELRLARTDPTPQMILSLANEYDVSIQAAAKKIVQIIGPRRSACSFWSLRSPWPIPLWWAGSETKFKPELERLEALAREKTEFTEEWKSYNRKDQPVCIQVTPTQGLNYALFFIKRCQ